MKGRQIVLDHLGDAKAAALMVDGQLDDLLVEGDAPAPGTIYRAVADRPVKGQGGMFLRTPDGSAFLRQVKGLSPGQPLLVQVTGFAEPGKAIPVTTRLLFKSRYAIVTPGAPGLNISRAIRDEGLRSELDTLARAAMAGVDPDLGLILRSACETVDDDTIADDIAAMRDLAQAVLADVNGAPELLVDGPGPHELAWRDWGDADEVVEGDDALEQTGALDQIESLADPLVDLGSGASMAIEPTRAVVAVDVNTGADTSPAAGLKASIAAIRDLPRQLALRGLGGMVLVDFAPVPKRERHVLEQSLKKAFKGDGGGVTLAGWTPLGNFELTRRRERVALADWLRG